MNNVKLFNPQINVTHLLITLAWVVGGIWFLFELAGGIAANESSIRHQGQLQAQLIQQQREDISELKQDSKDIKNLINELLMR